MDAKQRKTPGPCRYCGATNWEDMSLSIVDHETCKGKWFCPSCCSGFWEMELTYAPAVGTYQETSGD